MRILYFHQHFTTPDGTGGTRSYEFAKALTERGHRVTMVCGRSERSALQLTWDPARQWSRGCIEGIDVIALPLAYSNRDSLTRRTALFVRFAWRGLRLAWRKTDYDVLFATSTPLTAAIPGVVMKLFGGGRPFVFEIRDLWPELPRALGVKNPVLLGSMSMLEWLGYRTADACIGLSPGIVAGIRRRAPARRRVEMIPNGCDLKLFSPAKRRSLEAVGLNAGDFVAGFTGAHGNANGLDAVLGAAAELKRRGRDRIKLVLIGDGGSKESLVIRAQRERLDNVIFLAPVKKTDLAAVTAGFDCGLQILANIPEFYYGTSPNKFFDYLAAGIPVLCNYPGWLAELIVGKRCGVTVPPEDPGAFVDALCHLQDHPDIALEYGRNARLLAEDAFDRSKLSEEFVNVIESVTAQSP